MQAKQSNCNSISAGSQPRHSYQRYFAFETQRFQGYCIENDIRPDERIFPITERAVQKQLKIVCDWLGYEGISTHSFRKFFATEIYVNNDFNIILVQKLLQHSTPAVTQKYINISPKQIEAALSKHIKLQ